MLPHRFPFSFVERKGPDRVVFSISADSWWVRDGVFPPLLALEALAQGAALVLRETGSDEAKALYLAAIDAASFDEVLVSRPLAAGDQLEIEARLRLALGPLKRIEASLWREGERVVDASFTVTEPAV